ncbi:hypothetical protein LL946_04005 [Knoellia locipacati]|uniref:hypothetical protein n=1 Tax=Knoellia locipacati TaxID=882824 RepID=UPI00385167E4
MTHTMQTVTAQLPDHRHSDDRVFLTDNAVIVMDGASAFLPVAVPVTAYVDTLGSHLLQGLRADPEGELPDLLRAAIAHTAKALDLKPRHSPSSTVAMARVSPEAVDLLVLGDSQVATPERIMRDDRLAQIAPDQRKAYRTRLAAGRGYDDTHRALLRDLQAEQVRHRNVDGGYWIAEADPDAADHALTSRLMRFETPWLVLATDGAYKPMEHLGLDDWTALAVGSPEQLSAVLATCEDWEERQDPTGIGLVRAKRHDDKALATMRPG